MEERCLLGDLPEQRCLLLTVLPLLVLGLPGAPGHLGFVARFSGRANFD